MLFLMSSCCGMAALLQHTPELLSCDEKASLSSSEFVRILIFFRGSVTNISHGRGKSQEGEKISQQRQIQV